MLLVLDQFEQWLFARRGEQNTELVTALRQCDGEHVQAIVLVRDDFSTAAIRFMQSLEIPLHQGENSWLVDLFDLLHSEKVLAAFGRAYGRLPDGFDEQAREHEGFLKQAVRDLAQDGKVIPIRLSLFAEMLKGRPWTPKTLREVGGMAGVGLRFLKETFSEPTSPPEHRLHQEAAQSVLKSLLPEVGRDIKECMRSETELCKASGYADRPRDFEDLIHILNRELRLITPTRPEESAAEIGRSSAAGDRHYQLTHDYLIPSLRDWLTEKQRETRRGRAELKLAERLALRRPPGVTPPAIAIGVDGHPRVHAPSRLVSGRAPDDVCRDKTPRCPHRRGRGPDRDHDARRLFFARGRSSREFARSGSQARIFANWPI